MAASSATAECKEECKDKDDDALTTTLHTCANDPDFAVICAFLQKFAKDLGLALPNFKHLQEWLTNNDEVPELRDLHIKLLRKTRKTVHEKSWESALSKFCFGYSVQDAWEIERFGYRNSSLKVKLRILRELLESQFERNAKFRANILTLNASSMRSQPIGRDRLGHSYWLTQDNDCNLRIYQEHLDEEIWQVVATNRDEFVNLIARLRGNEVVLPSKDIGEADEDTTSSSSSSNNAPSNLAATEEQADDIEEESHEAKVPNLKIKLRTPEQQLPEQQEQDLKPKKVKPLLITQAKLGGSPAPARKRPLEDVDSSPTALAAEDQHKKQRPTLLDTKRIKKPSRYESTKSEDDNEVDSEDSELDEGEEEEEESLDGEEESLDSAAADEDENEQKFNEEDDEDDEDDEDEVGDAIEEPTLTVRGNGAGQDCEAIPEDSQFLNSFGEIESSDEVVGETIEESVYYVYGPGSGTDCLVGNGKNETSTEEPPAKSKEPQATFFFGEPGCLKLSPIKQAPKQETKRSIFDSLGSADSGKTESEPEPEKTNGESVKGEDVEKQSVVLNGIESAEDKEEEEEEEATKSQPSKVTESEAEVKEKPIEANEEEKSPVTRTENSETKEISNEQPTEMPKESKEKTRESEESVEQPYKVRVIETSDERLEVVKESFKTEEEKKANDIDPSKNVQPVVEKVEDIKEISKNHNESETTTEDLVTAASNKATSTENTLKPELESAVIVEKTIQDLTETIKSDEESVAKEETPVSSPLTTAIKVDVSSDTNGAEPVTNIDNSNETIVTLNEVSKNVTETSVNKEVTTKAKDTESIELPSTSKDLKDTLTETLKEIKPEEKPFEANEIEQQKPEIMPQADPIPLETTTKTAIQLPNRKRRLVDFTAPPARLSTSESEIDAQPEEEQQQLAAADDSDDDLDVGGKRIKMRPKITNVEVRRKVEAQKTQIEETTSSSGEEDLRSRRRIIAPKRHLEKPIAVKQKPTLAEIIEKKLKKTPEMPKEELTEQTVPQNLTTQPAREITPEKVLPVSFIAPKKSPITKPLKKNLLTQIRLEESDEEATPRKRTNSETVVAPAPPPATFECSSQRKRRSSEEAKESKESSVSEEPPAVSEKLKRNNEPQLLEEEPASELPEKQESSPHKLDLLAVHQAASHSVKEFTLPAPKETTPPPVKAALPILVNKDTPPAENELDSSKVREDYSLVKEATPPPVKEATPPPVRDAEPPPIKKATPSPIKEATPPPIMDATSPPVKEAPPSQLQEATPSLIKEATSPPATSLPVKEATPPPVREATPPQIKEATPNPIKEATPPPNKKAIAPTIKEEVPTTSIEKPSTSTVRELTPPPPVEIVTSLVKQSTPPLFKRAAFPSSRQTATNKQSTPPNKQLNSTPSRQSNPTPAKQATPPPLSPATEQKPQLVKEATPPPAKELTPPPAEASGRRSGRRGGAAVVHSELPQAKRTRGGPKEKPCIEQKPNPIKDPLEIAEQPQKEEEQTSTTKTKSPLKEDEAAKVEHKLEPATKPELSREPSPNVEPKVEPAMKTEAKSKQLDDDADRASSEEPIEVKPRLAIAGRGRGRGRGRGPRKTREVDTTNIIELNDSETPVRQSRRIAQQKIKEEAERRKLEEVALRTMKQQLKKKKMAEAEADPTVVEPSAESESFESASEAEEAKKKIKKKCPGKDGGWSSDSEEQAETEEEEEEPPHYETDPGSPLFKSDHEFSPESELEDESQAVPMKRARTLRKENADEEEYSAQAEADESCQTCGKSDHPEWILLCDTPDCNKGYHCSCLSPVLFYIPEGDWHCPPCQQEQLIAALEQQLLQFDDSVARKHQEKLQAEEAERLAVAAAAARTASELEERSNSNARKKNDDDDSDDNKDHDDDDDDDDDDDGASSSKANKRAKADKSKRRRGDGRSNRRAAKRGTRRRRGGKDDDSESGSSAAKSGKQPAGGRAQSGSSSSSGSSTSSFSDSDDEPIYKLRKRRQINVSYRLNEYDDLINSALKKEMAEVAGAGNLGRGKDISTIIEADKEKMRRDEEGDQPEDKDEPQAKAARVALDSQDKSSNEENDNSKDDDDDDEDEQPLKTVNKSKNKSAPPAKKKSRKLTTLDVSSEEDHGSDEDFKTSSFSDDDSSQSASDDSDSSLEIYRRPGRGKKQRKAARRAARERRKDRKFVVEESDDSDEEEQQRQQRSKAGKSKKKKKDDSDYTETETDDDEDNGSELTENMDSADLCDDTTSESEDGAWNPSKRKKAAAKKSSAGIARKSPKLKKPVVKKPKQLEYSDDDISESEEEDEEDDDDEIQMGANGAPMSGKGSGKQPRSQPLKKTMPMSAQAQASTGKGKGKGKGGNSSGGAKKKKKPSVAASSDEGGADAGSDERTRTRGRRYAYIEDFDDDSSDGGIKPGVMRPDTPPEERQKFIQKQEEIKRMLAEKNAEGAKLAATPRLTPIKGSTPGAAAASQEKRTPSKAGAASAGGDSLSTVPLSVIRQAKVLDIDYLQRKGEAIDDLDDVDGSELDDAELPDDLPEDMEDAIARMVEEEEQFTAAAAARELPAPDDVLRTTPLKSSKTPKQPTQPEHHMPSASGLQEPLRKRLPMPTMHPPLLRHQFPPHGQMPASLLPPPPQQQLPPGMHPMLQRHLAPPPQAMQLLQNALSAPLGQPLSRANYAPSQQQQLPAMQRLPLGMSMPAAAAHLMQAAAAAANVRPPAAAPEPKPRGRRKKVTPLRDQLQKQQAAAAVTAATSNDKPATSGKAPPPGQPTPPPPQQQLFKPHDDPPPPSSIGQASVITRMPMPSLLPPAHTRGPPSSAGPPPGAGMYPSSAELARFYGQPLPPSSALRPTYGAPPPLRGAPPSSSSGPPPGSGPNARPPPYLHGPEHHGGPPGPPGAMGGVYGSGPPPARHASPHLNPYRAPPIYGNPNYQPRVGPPGSANMRPGAVDYAAGARGYPPYGYYPPPPLTTPPAHAAAPSSVIVSAPPPTTPTNHSVSALTRGKSPAPVSAAASVSVVTPVVSTIAPPAPPAAITTEVHKSSVITSKKLITLEAYSNTKSPLAVVGESTGDSPSAVGEEDSSSAHGSSSAAVAANSVGGGVGEFSGLVSYFSSQQDDYDT